MKVVEPIAGEPNLYLFWCPGCGYGHHVDTRRWNFNGDLERPTVRPSVLVHGGGESPRCHCFVTDGEIRFLDDCGHDLRGQTVRMTRGPWD